MKIIKDSHTLLSRSYIQAMPLWAFLCLILAVSAGTAAVAQDQPAEPDEPGFGLGAVEVGLGIAPLGLTSESDLDVFIEYGGFVSLITRNPDGIMLRFSGSMGNSRVNAPAEFLSEGPVTLARFDASLMYGSYFYGGAGMGYAILDHKLGEQALEIFRLRGQSASESIESTTYYVARFGVRSEGRLGYFVEGVISLMQPLVNTTVTDLPTGKSASGSERIDLNIFHFFHLGIAYRF